MTAGCEYVPSFAGACRWSAFARSCCGTRVTAGLHGTVRNAPDGTLECVLEGPRDDVQRVIAQLRRGPSHARVDAVDVEELDPTGALPPISVTA